MSYQMLKYKLKKHRWNLKLEGNVNGNNYYSLTCNGKSIKDFDVVYITSTQEIAAYYQGYQVATINNRNN